MTGISLVMATIHREIEVQRCLDSLRNQEHDAFELIVVDQNPDDRLCKLLAEYAASGRSVIHIRQKEPNQCLARNAGLAAARFEVVAFPDDDCWYEPDTLRKVSQRMAEPDHPSAVVIRWIEQDPSGQSAHYVDSRRWRQFREIQASMITQFYRRKCIEDLEGFDSRLGLHSWFGGAEETDLMFRVLDSAVTVAYLPGALVHHPFFVSLQDQDITAFLKRARSRARGTGALYAKHRLDIWVIFRGLLAPFLIPLLKADFRRALCGLFISLGRMEGMIRWRFWKSI